MVKKFLIIFLTLLILPLLTFSASQHDVLINEIAWMGTSNSANDEWIELFNTTDKNIDLSGWFLNSADDKLKVNLKGQIMAGGFYLLERTDNSSLPQIAADLIYRGALNNGGASLKLYDNLGNLIDEVNYSTGWPAGNNKTKQTMESIGLGSWQTSQSVDGTPKAQNSPGIKIASKPKSKPLPQSKKFDNDIATASIKDAASLVELQNLTNFNQEKADKFSPWLLFLITIATILALAIIILAIKFKVFKNNIYS